MSIKKIAYFDNAATTFIKPKEVHNFMHEFYAANSVNIGRGNHNLLIDAQQVILETRRMLLSLFRATSEYTVVLTSSATEALNIIIQGQNWKSGQNVYISPFEHNAVYRTVKFIEREKGIKIHELAVDRTTLQFSLDQINRQFSDNKPDFVIITHVSNVCGNIAPIQEIGMLAKDYGAIYAVDCAQSAGLLETDIVKSCADYMVFAGHKTLYGPFGCSGFMCKKHPQIKPLIYGGTGIDSSNELMPNDVPTRYEAGSYNILSIAGLHAALTWRKTIGNDAIRKQEEKNFSSLFDILSKDANIEILGEPQTATSIVSCKFKDLPADVVEHILSQKGIIVRSGLHCAPVAHKFLGTYPEGTVRFSVSYFTNDNDFDLLQQALYEIVL